MKQINITIDEDLFLEAKQYRINISEASRNGIRSAIEREKKIREAFGEA